MAATDAGGGITPEARPRVTVEAVDAFVCGAAGCRRRDQLVRVAIDRWGERVVCRDVHLRDLVDRVLGGDRRDG